jgi:hypothetical protein
MCDRFDIRSSVFRKATNGRSTSTKLGNNCTSKKEMMAVMVMLEGINWKVMDTCWWRAQKRAA